MTIPNPRAPWAAAVLALGLALPSSGQPRAGWPGGPQRGATALRAGQYEDAEAAYRADSDAPGARAGLAETLRLQGRYREALASLERGADPTSAVDELLARARIQMEIGDGAAAEDTLRALLESGSPGEADLRAETWLGLLEFRRGRPEAGLSRLDGVIDAYNASPGRIYGARELSAVGQAAAALGFQSPGLFQDALRVFDEAAALDPEDPEPRLLAAELLLRKFNTAEALESIGAVLRKNPHHPRALFLMAQVQDRQRGTLAPGLDGSDALVEALAVNPRFPPARALEIQRLLERDRLDEARSRAAAAAAELPRSPEILAALGAVHFLAAEAEALAGVEGRFREQWAGDPGLDLALGSAAERQRRYREAAARARAALQRRPDSVAAGRLLGLNLLRLGEMQDGRRILEATFARDPYDALVKNTLDLLDELDGFRTVSAPPFEFVLPALEAELLHPYLEEISREALESFRRRYGFAPQGTVRIEIYDRSADFSVRTVGITGIGAHGVCFGNVIAMESPSAREIGSYHWASTLWHELAHTVAMGLTDNRVPRWFTEGLSMLEERRRFGDGAGLAFLAALRDGRLLDVAHLNDGFVRPTWPGQVAVSYYHASLVLEHIERHHGFTAIRGMLDGYRLGLDSGEVIEDTLGMDAEALNHSVNGMIEARFGAAARGLAESASGAAGEPHPPTPPRERGAEALLAAAAAAPDNFVLQLRAGIALYETGRDDEALDHLERARQLAPEYGGADGPLRYVSLLHERAERSGAAVSTLTEHLARVPAAYDDWLRLASMHTANGNHDGAAAALSSAIEAYPMLTEPHEQLAEAAAARGYSELEVRERQTALATRPADRAEALYRLARAHSRAGDRSAARRRVLEALEIAPTFDAALRLLLELRNES